MMTWSHLFGVNEGFWCIDGRWRLCIALKATGFLGCLQMKIISFRMKLK